MKPTYKDVPLGCRHGRPLLSHCAQCRNDVERARREFERDVFFGVYDREGYTPAERKAQQKKAVTT